MVAKRMATYEYNLHYSRFSDSLPRIMREATLAQGLAALQAREDQTDGAEHEVGARAACDAHHLLAIDGQIVAQHAETEAEGHHIQPQQPAAQEEESVEGEFRLVAHHLLLRELDGGIDEPSDAGHNERYPEQQFETVGVLKTQKEPSLLCSFVLLLCLRM